jgi:hypothetical protein
MVNIYWKNSTGSGLCDRLLDLFPSIQDKPNMIIVKDISTIHRKYLYDLLIEKGFNKKFLYTSYTTYPR